MTDDLSIPNSSRLAVPSHVLSRRAGDETVLLNLDNEQYFGLDGVGDRMWQLLEAGRSFEDVIDALLLEFDVDRQTLERDIATLVQDLVANGLLIIDAA